MTKLALESLVNEENLISDPNGLTYEELTFEQVMAEFFPGHCSDFIAIMCDLLSRCKNMNNLAINQIGFFGESLVYYLENEMYELQSKVGEEAFFRDVHSNILHLVTSPQFFLWSIAENEDDHVRTVLLLEIQDEIETFRKKEEAIILEIANTLDALSHGVGTQFKERLKGFLTSKARPYF